MLRSRCALALLSVAALGALLASRTAAQEAVPRAPRYDEDIRPLLTARCLKCHGNAQAEGGLRLTERAGAVAELESGAHAITPGDPEKSELIRRVTAADDGERMPPEGPALKENEIALLRAWIAAGADWPVHWAYRTLAKVALPRLESPAEEAWVRNPVDCFVLAKMRERGLAPSREADRRTLLRRVYFDLIGLPPTPAEIDAFLADASPDAYERVVDRLLAGPAYGERLARHWMDLVHYAETHGHDQDRPREHAWPYRDYLIGSFNADKPFAQFIEEQVAGDALNPNDPQAIVATGFLATGPWDESSLRDIRDDTLDREVARYIDRDDIVSTVMSTFTSSTVHCARCHDHKFDPITQQQYYGLQAVFAATDKAERTFDPDAEVAAKRKELTVQLAALPERAKTHDKTLLAADVQQIVAADENRLRESLGRWKPVEIAEFQSGGGAQLKKLDDDSLLAGGTRPDKDTYALVVKTQEARLTALRLEVLPDASLPVSGPGRQDNGNLHLSEFRAWIMVDGPAGNLHTVVFKDAKADFNQADGWSIDRALDGNPNTAWGIYPEVGKAHQAVFGLAEPVVADGPLTVRIEMEQLHGGGHLIGRFRITTTGDARGLGEAAVVSPRLAEILHNPRDQRSDDEQIELIVACLQANYQAQLAELPPPQLVYCGTNEFKPDGTFRPSPTPRTVHVLKRGNVTQPMSEAAPCGLSCLPEFPGTLEGANVADDGARRAALARWLSDTRNVLVWRSMANRLWQYHFGRGIVDSPNDFGRMGSVPSHPELLDWLTLELQRTGGSLKDITRLLVTSSVYRQSSDHNEVHARVDGENRLLWRMNRTRLDAEAARDAVLAIAGTLDATMGGPSVKQFIQTPGIHVTPNVDYVDFDVDDPANYRRSVYRFVFRTLPDPFMDALDCPDASQLTPQRNISVTALQALAMLNDKLVIRQSEHLAARICAQADDVDRQTELMFRQVLGRAPTASEKAAVGNYVGRHGLANACRFLWNSNEFIFVD